MAGWGDWLQLAIDAYGAYQGNQAGKAGEKGAQQGIDELRREFDINQTNQAPWLQAGKTGLAQLVALNGGDYSGLFDSPDYKATFAQGQGALDSSAAARGGLFGGGHTKDSINYGANLAAQQLGAYRSALESQSGLGQSAANSLGNYGQAFASNMANAYGNLADARQSSYGNNAAAAGNLGGWFAQHYGTPSYTGTADSPGSYSNFGNNMGNFMNTGWGGG